MWDAFPGRWLLALQQGVGRSEEAEKLMEGPVAHIPLCVKHHWYPDRFPSSDWDINNTSVPRLHLESWIWHRSF